MELYHIILGLLTLRPMTGYELKQTFDTSLGNVAGASFGSIYPILKKLRDRGLATVAQAAREGRPVRKVYSITAEGRRVFKDALGSELDVPPFRNVLMVRFFFFDALSPKAQEETVGQYLRHIEKKRASLKALGPLVRDFADPYQKMGYRFGLRMIEHYRENTRKLAAELRQHHRAVAARKGGAG